MAAPVDTSAISDQIRAEIQVKQFRDFLGQYNQLSENCFKHCIWDFRTRDVKNQEDSCVSNCVDKFTKVWMSDGYLLFDCSLIYPGKSYYFFYSTY